MTKDDDRTRLLEQYAAGFGVLESALAGITDAELDHQPGADDWTPRQVAHHVADSETTAYVRLRRILAEDDPQIVGYDEAEFARRLHYDRPIEPSLAVVRAVREASLQLLKAIAPDEWQRAASHTESGRYSVDHWLEIYAAHPADHAAQITRARRAHS
ncbi:MAG TPA: DinB family protein [Candidatus Limnocylindrales bacterium]|jgi:hypothetical protein